jgi:hypothetical protein
VVAALLNGLPSDYDVVRTIIENTTQLLALNVVLPKLVIEEAKLMAVMTADRAKAYAAAPPDAGWPCRGVGVCGEVGRHWRHRCERKRMTARAAELLRTHCRPL